MIEGRSVIGVVTARAGSRRLPGKNLRPMAGRPMIAWTLDAARESRVLDRVVVTSDDAEVLRLAAEAGAMPVSRPAALAGDAAAVVDAVEHALAEVGGAWDYVVLLQPTSPLRLAEDIDGAAALCVAARAPAVVGVCALPKPAGFYRTVAADGRLSPADDLSAVRLVNGAVYVIERKTLLRTGVFHPEGAVAFPMPADRSWDVDDRAEFAVCETLLKLRMESGL